MKTKFLGFALVALVGGCTAQVENQEVTPPEVSLVADKEAPADNGESFEDAAAAVQAWSPGNPIPHANLKPDHGHRLDVVWREVGSLKELTDMSTLVVRGHVTARRFDALRSKAENAGGEVSFHDAPVTVATVSVDEIIRAEGKNVTSSGATVEVKRSVDIILPGGLLKDGCTVDPDDSPLPKVGEEAVFLLTPLNDVAPLGTENPNGVYVVNGGPQGRINLKNGLVAATAGLRAEPVDSVGMRALRGKPVKSLRAALLNAE